MREYNSNIFKFEAATSSRVPAVRRAERFAPVSRLEDDLFQRAEEHERISRQSRWKILLVGFEGHALRAMRHMCYASGGATTASFRNCDDLAHLRDIRYVFSHVIVNEAGFPSVDVAIDTLIKLRPVSRDIAILLQSAQTSVDDYGSERDCLCDGTLGKNLTAERLQQGLRTAAEKLALRDLQPVLD